MRKLHYFIFLFYTFGGCASIEKPNYQVIKQYDSFEIRQYPPQLVAEVLIENDFDKACH